MSDRERGDPVLEERVVRLEERLRYLERPKMLFGFLTEAMFFRTALMVAIGWAALGPEGFLKTLLASLR